MFKLFKRNKPEPRYDYASALAQLSAACQKNTVYSVILPSLFYDAARGKFAVHFECTMKEYVKNSKKNKYFLSLRRSEKIWSSNLEQLLDFAVEYASFDDAFMRSPQDNLPEGITMSIKNFLRTPNGYTQILPKWKI